MWDIQVRIAEYWEELKNRQLDESEQAEFKLLMDEQAECVREILELREQYRLAKMTGDTQWGQEILDKFHVLQKKLIY